MTRLYASLGLLLALEAVAFADFTPTDSPVGQFDPDDAVAPITSVEGPGIKIGEGTVLHPAFGLEGGYTSNVFYTATNPTGAGILRALAQITTGSLSAARMASGDSEAPVEPDFQYRAGLRASYDALLSGNSVVRDTGGLGLGATFHGVVNPAGTWTFGIDEDFSRVIRAANFETSTNVNRDINAFGVNLLWHPIDRSVSGFLYYNNTLDIFEQNQDVYPDRLLHHFGVHPQWRIFPETQVFVDISGGFDSGLGNTTKESSFPLAAVAGVQTLLTLDLTLAGQIGYTNGFYGNGTASYSAPTGSAQLGYRYSPFGRILLAYNWLYSDSINANYYRDEVISALLVQEVKPLVFEIQPELHFREYNGISTLVPGAVDTRDDTIVSVIAGVHYIFRNWIAATLDYHFTDVSTDYRYPPNATGQPFNPSYVRHDILVGVRVAM